MTEHEEFICRWILKSLQFIFPVTEEDKIEKIMLTTEIESLLKSKFL